MEKGKEGESANPRTSPHRGGLFSIFYFLFSILRALQNAATEKYAIKIVKPTDTAMIHPGDECCHPRQIDSAPITTNTANIAPVTSCANCRAARVSVSKNRPSACSNAEMS